MCPCVRLCVFLLALLLSASDFFVADEVTAGGLVSEGARAVVARLGEERERRTRLLASIEDEDTETLGQGVCE